MTQLGNEQQQPRELGAARNNGGGAIARPQVSQESRYENFDEDDFKMPMVHLYHGTPREEERFCAGSKKFDRGDLINTVSGEKLASRSFVPARGWKEYIQFDPNDDTSIVWRTKNKEEAVRHIAAQLNKPVEHVNPRDDLYDQTFYNYVVFFDGEPLPMLLSFSRTGADAGRTLNMMEMQRAKAKAGPGYYAFETRKGISKGVDRRTGEVDPKKKGQNYLRPAIRSAGKPPEELVEAATNYFLSSQATPVSVADVMKETGDVAPDGQFDPSQE